MPLRGCCAWTAHFSTICFTRVGECPFTGQHDLPSSLGVEVRRTPIVKVGCCRVGRLVQPHLEMETQRKCDGPRGVQELAPRKRLVLRSSRSRILATVVMLLRATRFHSEVHPKWVPRVMISGQVETDKWPLVLARPWGLAAVLSVRRGRVSADGSRQIAKIG